MEKEDIFKELIEIKARIDKILDSRDYVEYNGKRFYKSSNGVYRNGDSYIQVTAQTPKEELLKYFTENINMEEK